MKCWHTVTTLNTPDLDGVKALHHTELSFRGRAVHTRAGGREGRLNVIPRGRERASGPETWSGDTRQRRQDGMLTPEEFNMKRRRREEEERERVQGNTVKWISCLFSTGAESELCHLHRHL